MKRIVLKIRKEHMDFLGNLLNAVSIRPGCKEDEKLEIALKRLNSAFKKVNEKKKYTLEVI